MSHKIIAIGGGNIGAYPYPHKEMEGIINEMVNLTGKEKPNLLFLAHSCLGSPAIQRYYYRLFQESLHDKFNISFLSSDDIRVDLVGREPYDLMVRQADIIYEHGGDTYNMIKYWKNNNFDDVLRGAYDSGKVMSGFSAGANCWFEGCSSDYLKMAIDDSEPFISLNGLGLHKGFFIPHCDESDRIESAKEFLRENDMVGFFLSNGAALEIVDDKYRILTGDNEHFGISPYALKGYWLDDEYHLESLDLSSDFKDVNDLLSKTPCPSKAEEMKRILKKET